MQHRVALDVECLGTGLEGMSLWSLPAFEYAGNVETDESLHIQCIYM
jgi:hypothetical protein